MDAENAVTKQPEIKIVRHNPDEWKSMGPEVLAQTISDIAKDCGLNGEIVYILLTQGWMYIYANEEDYAHWRKVPVDGN